MSPTRTLATRNGAAFSSRWKTCGRLSVRLHSFVPFAQRKGSPALAAVDLKASIESKQSRRRYLEHLDSAEERAEEETTCPICAEHFSKGVLTTCGHLTCASCFRKWHGHSRSCALCKQALPQGSYQTVSVRLACCSHFFAN